MNYRSMGFIGGGRITRIFLTALQKVNKLPQSIIVSDADPNVLAILQKEFPSLVAAGNDNTKPASCDIVFVSLHPPVLVDALQQIKSVIKPDAVVVSLAPKITLSKLTGILDRHARIVRMIPNAPSIMNRGYNPVAFSRAVSIDSKEELIKLFEIFGDCPEVPEENLETYAILTAMGPTYLWFQWQTLVELARSFGLNEDAIKSSLPKMIEGAATTFFASGMSPEEVMDLIPVKPLAADEQTIRDMYSTKLNGLYAKLKGLA